MGDKRQRSVFKKIIFAYSIIGYIASLVNIFAFFSRKEGLSYIKNAILIAILTVVTSKLALYLYKKAKSKKR